MAIMVVTMGHHDKVRILPIYFTQNFLEQFKLTLAVKVLCCFFLSSVFTVKADITPRLTVTQYYNDNVSQAQHGLERHAYISEVQPGINVSHDGRRVDAQFDYTLQALYFSGEHDKDEVYHSAYAQAELNLLPQVLFFDADINYSEQFISPDGVIDLDNLSDSNESVGVTTYRMSPYVRQRYGNFADAEYRIQQEKVQYAQNNTVTQTDSISTVASINVSSGLAFDEFRWQLILLRNELKAENAEDSIIKTAEAQTSYRIMPKVDILVNIGYEKNDFQYANANEDPSGEYWSAGFRWNPGRRTQFQLTRGERFFGKTTSLLVNHRTRRSIWNVSYSEEVTTTPQLLQADEPSPEPVDGEPVIPPNPGGGLLVREASVVLQERFSVGVGWLTGKTSIDFSAYEEKRTYLDIGQGEKTRGGLITLEWRFMPRTTLRLSGTRSKLEFLANDRIDYLGYVELAVVRQIRRTITGTLGLRQTNNNSTDNTAEYDRNLAFVSLAMEF